ncbi:MAG TPA: BON domain-containing protein [Burkholderiales bacterium]|nr:BON domain-containing protein [Burkholderiales bacterium]
MKQRFGKYLSAVFMAFALASFAACESTPTTRNAAEVTEDAAITTQVNAAFAGDALVKAYQIDVDTFRKVVTLSGKVESQAAINKAVELARKVSDVKSVQNKLTLK